MKLDRSDIVVAIVLGTVIVGMVAFVVAAIMTTAGEWQVTMPDGRTAIERNCYITRGVLVCADNVYGVGGWGSAQKVAR